MSLGILEAAREISNAPLISDLRQEKYVVTGKKNFAIFDSGALERISQDIELSILEIAKKAGELRSIFEKIDFDTDEELDPDLELVSLLENLENELSQQMEAHRSYIDSLSDVLDLENNFHAEFIDRHKGLHNAFADVAELFQKFRWDISIHDGSVSSGHGYYDSTEEIMKALCNGTEETLQEEEDKDNNPIEH